MLKEKIKNKEKTIGMYVQLADISIARIAGLAGYDFVWVDTEHSYMSYETLLGHIIAIKATGTPVVVRVPQDDLTATKKVLEMGVDGIIFPMVKSAEEAERVISSTLYPIEGNRGFGPMNAIDYGMKDVKKYINSNRDDLCRFIQIEHRDTVENIDEIMSFIELIVDITENVEVYKKYIPRSRKKGWMRFVYDVKHTPAYEYYMKKHQLWYEVKE